MSTGTLHSSAPATESPADRPAVRLPVLDLTALARGQQPLGGTFPPALIESLSRGLYRSSRHVLLVGEPGIGKTTLIQELARQAVAGELPHLSATRCLWADGRRIPPGEGPAFLEALSRASAHDEHTLWCLDPLPAFLRNEEGRLRTAPLAALLGRTAARILAVINRTDALELQSRDPELCGQFTRVELLEPEEPATLRIVQEQANRLAVHYQLEISPTLVQRTVALTSTFLLSDRQPAKSIKLLQRVCEDLVFERTQQGQQQTEVRESRLMAAVAEQTGIPPETIGGETVTGDFVAALREAVVGQEPVIETVARELRRIKSGLNEPGKPASVMLFAGMTGVGKTELAKRIAELYSSSRRLQTYTMANFTEPHSVSGIIGVPPGYVGFEEGGRLINELNADPYAVFLLDEAEKAHPHVWKPFLNLFDEGWITDQRGVKAWADRAIFILTTNAGDRNIAQMIRTGQSPEEIEDHLKQTLAKVRHERSSQPVFPPAFLARIGRVLVFQPLEESGMVGIAQRVCGRLQRQWRQKRNQRLVIAPELIELIGRRGHQRNAAAQGREGGRIIKKLVSEVLDSRIQESATGQPEAFRAAHMISVGLRNNPPVGEQSAGEDHARLAPADAWPPEVVVTVGTEEAP